LVSAGTPRDSGPSVVVTPDLLPARPARLDAVRLLSLDAHGRVLDWMSWQDATCLYVRGAVAWTLGDPCLSVPRRDVPRERRAERARPASDRRRARPRQSARTRSDACIDQRRPVRARPALVPVLRAAIARDNISPATTSSRCRGRSATSGKTSSPPASTAIRARAVRTPQQASMPLLAVPYRPSWIEHLILSNRNILADQMAFLKNHLPKRSRLS
jgi:hypothetical protein